MVERRAMIEAQEGSLSVSRQCELVGLPRSSFYYQPAAPDAFTLEVMHAIDRIYTDRPFYGVRRIWKTLRDDGYLVNHKRVHRLMQLMGLQAIYPRKRLSLPDKAHRVILATGLWLLLTRYLRGLSCDSSEEEIEIRLPESCPCVSALGAVTLADERSETA